MIPAPISYQEMPLVGNPDNLQLSSFSFRTQVVMRNTHTFDA